MSTYKVEICGVNTAQLPILKEEEKDELFKKIKAGDKASRETYIKGNLRLVLYRKKSAAMSRKRASNPFYGG